MPIFIYFFIIKFNNLNFDPVLIFNLMTKFDLPLLIQHILQK